MFWMYMVTEEDTWYTSENKTLCEVHFFVAQYKKIQVSLRCLSLSDPFVTWNYKKVLMQTNPCETLQSHPFNLNPHKAAGPDQIKPIILTNLSTPLSPILKHKSSSTRKPFHQSGRMLMWRLSATKCERSNPANYMPISLTCILCKTLEHIVASSIKTPI